MLQRPAVMMSKGNIHENGTAFRFKAHDQSLDVFAAFAAFRGGYCRRMNPEVESLVVQHRDRVSNNLVGKFTDRFADQIVRARQFRAG
jgi:type VI protein secretion system component VasK